MAVVAVNAPRLQDAVRVAVFSGPSDVIHQLITPALDDGFSDPRADVRQRGVPLDALPFALAPRADAPHRIEDPVRVIELVRRDDTLGARATAAAGMERIAFDLPNGKRLLIDVGENAAGGFAVETDARDHPILPAILLRPAGGLEVDVVVPL